MMALAKEHQIGFRVLGPGLLNSSLLIGWPVLQRHPHKTDLDRTGLPLKQAFEDPQDQVSLTYIYLSCPSDIPEPRPFRHFPSTLGANRDVIFKILAGCTNGQLPVPLYKLDASSY
jgi:hypothetical protein